MSAPRRAEAATPAPARLVDVRIDRALLTALREASGLIGEFDTPGTPRQRVRWEDMKNQLSVEMAIKAYVRQIEASRAYRERQ